MNIIILNDFYYENLFKNLSLIIKKNSFTTISGPNNSGKTTLIRILNREIITDNIIMIKEKDINDYLIEDYSKVIQCVIPKEIIWEEESLEDELLNHNNNQNQIEEIIKGLKLKKIIHKPFKELKSKDIVLSQIALALSKSPEILLLDDLASYLDKKIVEEVIDFLLRYQKDKDLTIIMATIHLEESIKTDYLYIIGEGKIELSGLPIEILKKDNIINKIGLKLPFMIDLSVKLIDYNLLDSIQLEKDRMVDELWK